MWTFSSSNQMTFARPDHLKLECRAQSEIGRFRSSEIPPKGGMDFMLYARLGTRLQIRLYLTPVHPRTFKLDFGHGPNFFQ